MPTVFRVEYIIAGVLLAMALLAYAFKRSLGLQFFRLFFFVAAVLVGQFTAPICFVLAVKFGLIPRVADNNPLLHQMTIALTEAPWAVWILGVLIAFGFFMAKRREIRFWCLFAPVYIPATYMLLALLYFNSVP